MKKRLEYTERQSMDDARGILDNVMHRKNATNQTCEELAAYLRQIMAREVKK